MDDVEVDLVDAEPSQAALDLRRRVAARRVELGGDEHLLAGDTAVAKRTPDAPLVAVGLRGVDVPVSGFERPADRPLALGAIGDLPYAQPEQRDGVAVGKRPLLTTNHALVQHVGLLTVETKRSLGSDLSRHRRRLPDRGRLRPAMCAQMVRAGGGHGDNGPPSGNAMT